MKTVDWSDNRRLTVIRCPSCGAPATVKSLADGGCEYCKTAYSHPNNNFDEVKLYADDRVISNLVVTVDSVHMTVARGYGT